MQIDREASERGGLRAHARGSVARAVRLFGSFGLTPDEWTNWLNENVAAVLKFRHWFFGHYHIDMPEAAPFTSLYESIVEL